MQHDDPETIVMTIRPGLQITQTCFRVGTRHYALDSLRELQTRQSAHDPLTKHAALLAVGGAVTLVSLWQFMQPAGRMLAGVVLFGLMVLTLISSRSRPRRMELWALHHGRETQLFASEDWWIFTAVERQLRRSLTESRFGQVATPWMAPPTSAVPHPSVVHPSKMHPANN
jgi:hypothetical protein